MVNKIWSCKKWREATEWPKDSAAVDAVFAQLQNLRGEVQCSWA